MAQTHGQLLQRPAVPVGIYSQGHCGAGAEPGHDVFIGRWPGIAATKTLRFVRSHHVVSGRDELGIGPVGALDDSDGWYLGAVAHHSPKGAKISFNGAPNRSMRSASASR